MIIQTIEIKEDLLERLLNLVHQGYYGRVLELIKRVEKQLHDELYSFVVREWEEWLMQDGIKPMIYLK